MAAAPTSGRGIMVSRIAVAVLVTGLLAAPVGAESNDTSIPFALGDIVGTIYFTALGPGETASVYAPFAGYSQAASADFTYLYRLDNNSVPGSPTEFGN